MCEICNNPIPPSRSSRGAKTCSASCAKVRHRLRVQTKYRPLTPPAAKRCDNCDAEYQPYRSTSRFCSRGCSASWHQREKNQRSHTGTRPCMKCGTLVPVKPGHPVCADCKVDPRDPERAARNERRRTLRRYGITEADWTRMLAEQNGVCAICGTDTPCPRTGKTWHIDHCHETGIVRGLLCNSCNRGIGQLGDDPDRLEAAARYLRAARVKAVA